MYPSLALLGKVILNEAVLRVANKGIKELDTRLNLYIRSMKQQIERGNKNVRRAETHSDAGERTSLS